MRIRGVDGMLFHFSDRTIHGTSLPRMIASQVAHAILLWKSTPLERLWTASLEKQRGLKLLQPRIVLSSHLTSLMTPHGRFVRVRSEMASRL